MDKATRFKVSDLKPKDDAILHVGKFEMGTSFNIGDELSLNVDAEFRKTNARIHSAGHLLDIAMNRAGKKELKPGKGYHF
jgi:alanyl-tRNA synthetase